MSKRKLSDAFDEAKQIADDAENFEKYRDVMGRDGWDNYKEEWAGADDDIIGRPIIYKTDHLDSPFPATKGIIYKIEEGPIVRICYSGQEEQHTDRIPLNQINKDSTLWKTEGITGDHILNAQMKYTPKRRGTRGRGSRRGTRRRASGTRRRASGTRRRGSRRSRASRTRRGGRGRGSRRGSRGRGRGRGIGSRGRVTRFRN